MNFIFFLLLSFILNCYYYIFIFSLDFILLFIRFISIIYSFYIFIYYLNYHIINNHVYINYIFLIKLNSVDILLFLISFINLFILNYVIAINVHY